MTNGRTPDAVVIGGGLIGTSIAYHLARAGVRTLLVEQGDLASGASGANFGNVQVADAEFGLSLELTLRGYARFAALEAELDYDIGYRRTGSLLLIENPPQRAILEDRAAQLRAAGLPAALLDGDEVRRLVPDLAPGAAHGALYNPDEGALDPFRLVHAFALRGRNLGLEVWTHTPATAIEVRGGRVHGIATPRGRVAAGSVILAAGAWSHALGQTAGLTLPMQWVHGEAAITEPVPPVTPHALSSAAFFEATAAATEQTVGFCLRQQPRGHVMIGEAARVTRALGRAAGASGLAAVAAEARRWLPALRRAMVIRSWAIPVAFTTDNRPLLGEVDGAAGLYVATALKSTIVLTPLFGALVAALVAGTPQDPRLAEFSPLRPML